MAAFRGLARPPRTAAAAGPWRGWWASSVDPAGTRSC